jgi:hypothetical protein
VRRKAKDQFFQMKYETDPQKLAEAYKKAGKAGF